MNTYELGDRFPSGVTFWCAGPSLRTTGALFAAVLGVAEAVLRSAWTGVLWVEGAMVGYDDFGLTGSLEGGASGGTAAEATAVLMLVEYVDSKM